MPLIDAPDLDLPLLDNHDAALDTPQPTRERAVSDAEVWYDPEEPPASVPLGLVQHRDPSEQADSSAPKAPGSEAAFILERETIFPRPCSQKNAAVERNTDDHVLAYRHTRSSTSRWNMFQFTIPFICSLGSTAAMMSIPLYHSGATSVNYCVLQFGLYQVWAGFNSAATGTFLYACAPLKNMGDGVVLVGLATMAPSVFWLVRYAINDGSCVIQDPRLVVWHMPHMLAILLPALGWTVLALKKGLDATHVHSGTTQLWLAAMVASYWCVVYVSLTLFMHGKNSSSPGFGSQMIWFIGFLFVNQFFKIIGKRLGLFTDRGKTGTFSLYFGLEFVCSLFYYLFYRSMFENVTSVPEFLGLQTLHIVHEYVTYIARLTPGYLRLYAWIFDSLSSRPRAQQLFAAAVLPPGVSTLEDMQCFVAMDVGLRVCASIFSSAGYLMILLLIQYGWTSDQYALPSAFKAHSNQMNKVYLYLFLSTIIEFMNAAVVDHFFFRPKGLTIHIWASRSGVHDKWYSFVNVMSVGVVLLGNIVVSNFKYSK